MLLKCYDFSPNVCYTLLQSTFLRGSGVKRSPGSFVNGRRLRSRAEPMQHHELLYAESYASKSVILDL
jgi:hypothetical protein